MLRVTKIQELLFMQPGKIDLCNVIGLTIENNGTSALWPGMNEEPQGKRILRPGEQVLYGGNDNRVLDGNLLHIAFNGEGIKKALVTLLCDGGVSK